MASWHDRWSGVFPSVKTLAAIGLDKCWRDEALAVLRDDPAAWRKVLSMANDCILVRGYPGSSFRGGFGVEVLRGRKRSAYYANNGQTYDPTLMFVPSTGRFHVGSWGDWVEAEERRGNRFE